MTSKKTFSAARARKIIQSFSLRKLLVVGDIMYDRFIWGSVTRISPEAPVPVVAVERESACAGGSANVALNLRSLGASVVPLGVVGEDTEASEILRIFLDSGISTSGLVVAPERPTTTKTRIIAHNQQMVRVDREVTQDISAALQRSIIEGVKRELPSCDAVLISDYAKGVCTASLVKKVIAMALSAGKIIVADPKPGNFWAYKGVTVSTPNHHEAEQAVHHPIATPEDMQRAGNTILDRLGAGNLVITWGENGMVLFEGKKKPVTIPTVAREVFDVTGAGDTVAATLALVLACGATMRQAAVIANQAAGIVVGHVGTATLTRDELEGALLQ